jgi:hypothetical protein
MCHNWSSHGKGTKEVGRGAREYVHFWLKTAYEYLYELYTLPKIKRMIKPRSRKWAGYRTFKGKF